MQEVMVDVYSVNEPYNLPIKVVYVGRYVIPSSSWGSISDFHFGQHE